MIKDIIFVLLVLSVAVYAHSYKESIVDFIINEEEEEIVDEDQIKASLSSLSI